MANRRFCQHDDANSESHWTSTGASARKRKIVDVLGQESAENTRNSVEKRACLLNATISREEDVLGVGLNAGKVGRHVQSFSQVYTYDNASVHMGDRYGDGTTINHNYLGLGAAMNLRVTQDIEPSEEAAILRLAAVIIVAAIANVIVQPFLLLRNALCRAIPNAVQRHTTPLSSLFGSQMVSFEDALGRFERIDINVITDWTSFHYNLTRAFADQPGDRRVAVAGYRLFDHAQGSQLIDPRRPPPFASVFVRNRHVRMSIHFTWDEVSLECCPKCGLKQTCELEKETICQAKACGFSYRGHIKDAPIVELDNEDDAGVSREERPSMDATTEKRAKSRRHRLMNEQENPAWFSRISVSRQPEEISVPKSGTSPIFSGMSWGGLSRGSFLDDLLTSGTSSMMHNSMQSLSYLPKMEANYMKDYVCCDIRLDTMHELLQHYEETHSAQRVQKTVRTPHGHQYPSSRAANVQAQAVPQDLPAASHQQRQTIPQQPTFHHYQPHFSRPSSNHAYPTPTNMDYAATMPTDWQFQFQEAAAFQAQQQAQQKQQLHPSRPSSNYAHPTPTNMDYAATMPTDWQFQFQEAAAFQAQQQAQQKQQLHPSRSSSNHAYPTPVNMRTTNLSLDYATMMPTDSQFRFQKVAALQTQQQAQRRQQPRPSRPSSNYAHPTPTNMDYAATMPTDWQFQFQEAAAFQAQQQAQQQQQQQQQVQNR